MMYHSEHQNVPVKQLFDSKFYHDFSSQHQTFGFEIFKTETTKIDE